MAQDEFGAIWSLFVFTKSGTGLWLAKEFNGLICTKGFFPVLTLDARRLEDH